MTDSEGAPNAEGPETRDDKRPIVRHIGGQKIVFGRDGFILNPSLWSEEVAVVLAREIGIDSLSNTQWRVLRFIRQYYTEQGKVPINHRIKVGTGLSLKEIEGLFPGGIARGARRLAGMPAARGCAAVG
jgi:tRNA 2-thiouridine synthesizing protein E